ncbi:hypothetical protein Hanom_Chr10g00901581 [Helianthus anomalus]
MVTNEMNVEHVMERYPNSNGCTSQRTFSFNNHPNSSYDVLPSKLEYKTLLIPSIKSLYAHLWSSP